VTRARGVIAFLRFVHLRGPNMWTYRPVLEAWVDIGDLEDSPSNTIPGFPERLALMLPGLEEHRCSHGERGGFLRRLAEGTWPAHILEHVTLELQHLAGLPGGFGRARGTNRRGVYKVAVRAWHEDITRFAFHLGRDLLLAAMDPEAHGPFDVAAGVAALQRMKEALLPDVGIRPVADAAQPEGISVIGVAGSRGTTSTARLIARLLGQDGRRVGLACAEGLFLGGDLLEPGDCAHWDPARRLLADPRCEAAVIENGRDVLLSEGLPYDRCRVGVLTNIDPALLPDDGYVDSPERLCLLMRTQVDVVLPGGAAVLNAADPLVAEMARLSDGEVIFFAADPGCPAALAHRTAGGRVVGLRGGRVLLWGREGETAVADLGAFGWAGAEAGSGQVEVLLAAVAGAWALDLTPDQIRKGVTAFDPGRKG
jgi:hypothetical protein